jgi:hypothetical protein
VASWKVREMEGKTPTEKINYLANALDILKERAKVLDAAFAVSDENQTRTNHALAELKVNVVRLEEQIAVLQRWKDELGLLTDLRTDVAIVKRDVDKLEKVKEEWSRRFGLWRAQSWARW